MVLIRSLHLSRMKVRGSKTIGRFNWLDLVTDTLKCVLASVNGHLASVQGLWASVNDMFENVFHILPACFLSKSDKVNGDW
jgi:hypothetical protein